ncbi:CPBP family intramembrane glutamic endopeptidase [Euzebya tangerina]|uniref:CPBP family intramembrane glutamic endopeptidase n=1 Tax=Euzebya tangerina TaxID=591198 RepID=UPI000E324027|nr:CPBP family intramembrane glutamic endopeptidase [Euzebya tangerina]
MTQTPTPEHLLDIPVPHETFEAPLMDGRVRRYAIPWEWFDAIGIFVIWAVLQTVVGAVLLGVSDGDEPPTELSILLGLLLLILTTLGWVAVRSAAAEVPRGIRRAFGVKQIRPRDFLVGIGYGLAAFVVIQIGFGTLLTVLIEASGGEVPEVQQEVQTSVVGDGLLPLIVAFSVAVLAPLGEELWFRGVLYQALAKRVSGWPAIGLSGLAFGLTHGELLVVVLTFPLGMLLAWMLRRHGTLVVPIMAHAVFNLIGVALLRAGVGAA